MTITADEARDLMGQADLPTVDVAPTVDPATEQAMLTQLISNAASIGSNFVYAPIMSSTSFDWLKTQGFVVEIVPTGDGIQTDWHVSW